MLRKLPNKRICWKRSAPNGHCRRLGGVLIALNERWGGENKDKENGFRASCSMDWRWF